MGKVTNKILAMHISERIDEILDLTGLTLLGLAEFSDIGRSAIRSYHSKTIPISVEIVSKICESLSISLSLFFDFNTALPDNLTSNKRLKAFSQNHAHAGNGFFKEETYSNYTPVGEGRKYERDTIAYIIKHTDYFATPRTIEDMVTDFVKEYNILLESGRIYQLLYKYIGTVLQRAKVKKHNKDGSLSKKEIFTYVKRQ